MQMLTSLMAFKVHHVSHLNKNQQKTSSIQAHNVSQCMHYPAVNKSPNIGRSLGKCC